MGGIEEGVKGQMLQGICVGDWAGHSLVADGHTAVLMWNLYHDFISILFS